MGEVSIRVVLFFVIVGAVQLLLDCIVLYSWRLYIQRKRWSSLLYTLPTLVGVAMFILFPVTVYLRYTELHPSPLNKALHKLLAVWYVPKVPIALFILGYFGAQALLNRWGAKIVAALEYLIENTRAVSLLLVHRLHMHRVIASKEQKQRNQIHSIERRKLLTSCVRIGTYAIASSPLVVIGRDAISLVYDFDVQRVTIPIRNLPSQWEGVTIAQISDIHAGSFFSDKPIQEVCRIIESLRPDVVVVTGDWVNWRASELKLLYPHIQRLCRFAQSSARLGLWGCLGNHDHYSHGAQHQALLSTLHSMGVKLLINQNVTLKVDGAKLQLAGIDNIGLRQNYGRLDKALEGLAPDFPTILMAHDPTFWDGYICAKPFCTETGEILVDVTLSGHTHGGQIGVNVLGNSITPVHFLYKYCAGLYSDEHGLGQHIYVNRGIGTTGIPVRIGIAPEITLITLKKLAST
ncbi:MAG: metallophosphoesterase [Bacteroidota bacterium]|nr:metallophosphoesterase [Candidatus Kapabacteria bacterium]MDW8218960.1 metallophosphoesterase [Bacteroidota bacterium]